MILTTQGINFEQVVARMYDKYQPFTYTDELQNVERLITVLDVVSDYPNGISGDKASPRIIDAVATGGFRLDRQEIWS